MDWRRRLLWIDGAGGAVVGVLTLALGSWWARWTGLPYEHVLLMAGANLGYGAYSLTLASRRVRPLPLIGLLVLANGTWGVLCGVWLVRFAGQVTPLGWLHLGGEGLYVGGLAALEWRWRTLLTRAG